MAVITGARRSAMIPPPAIRRSHQSYIINYTMHVETVSQIVELSLVRHLCILFNSTWYALPVVI